MALQERMLVFDYKRTRLLIGIIAFLLPFAVSFISSTPLTSISASYYTEARDALVGMLFIVGAFLFAYNGYTIWQSWASKIGSIAAVLIALFPTNCGTCLVNYISKIHYCSAATLFLILTYFCFGPFRNKAKDKNTAEAGRRIIIYLFCGTIMVVCMLTMLISNFLPKIEVEKLRLFYWAEAVALVAFGTAWLTASKVFPVFAGDTERLRLFKRKGGVRKEKS
jgi:hypothetical protein